MKTITLLQPAILKFGNNCSGELAEYLLKTDKKKAFIVTDKVILDIIQPVLDSLNLGHIDCRVYDSIQAEPTISDFKKALVVAHEFAPDVVIGMGGGSVLDVAKLVAAMYENSQTIEEVFGIGNLKSRSMTLVCLPSTSGTGSEMSPNAILTDASNNKKGVVSPFLVPDASFIDPVLTITVPKSVTVATGIDAMIHCIEAYANNFAHPLIDFYALKGIELIASYLVKAYQNGRDLDARAALSLGSMFGGICLGPVNTAGIHALAYPLGTKYKLSHGMANLLLLPHVLRFNLEAAADRYADIAVAMGVERLASDMETAQACLKYIDQLFRELDVPLASELMKADEQDILEMAESAMLVTRLLKNNVREITLTDAIQIFTNVFKG